MPGFLFKGGFKFNATLLTWSAGILYDTRPSSFRRAVKTRVSWFTVPEISRVHLRRTSKEELLP